MFSLLIISCVSSFWGDFHFVDVALQDTQQPSINTSVDTKGQFIPLVFYQTHLSFCHLMSYSHLLEVLPETGIQPFFSKYVFNALQGLILYSKSCIYTNVRKAVTTDKTVYQIRRYNSTEQNSLSEFHTTVSKNPFSCFKNNFGFLDSKFTFKTICMKKKPTEKTEFKTFKKWVKKKGNFPI